MKAAIVTSWLSHRGGGVSAVVEAMSRDISLRDVEVRVFGLKEENASDVENGWAGASADTFPVIGPRSLGYSRSMAQAIIGWKPDLVHVHGIWSHVSRSVLQWFSDTNGPYIISPHGMLDPWALQNSAWKKNIIGRLYENRHLRHARCIHALNENEREAIRAFGLTNPVAIIPNGVDLPQAAEKQVSSGKRTLLFLGRLHPKKGVSNLLRAWGDVHELAPQEGAGWRLAIAGWGAADYEAELRELAGTMVSAGAVQFLGPQLGAQKASTFAGADAFILPSLSEGLPMTVLEAWAYRLPVLMTSQCNLPEGFAANAAVRIELDAERLREGILTFLRLPETERLEMGSRGRQLVEARFTWPVVATQMTDVYRWLIHGGARPPCVYV